MFYHSLVVFGVLVGTLWVALNRKKRSLGELFVRIANNVDGARQGTDIVYEVRVAPLIVEIR